MILYYNTNICLQELSTIDNFLQKIFDKCIQRDYNKNAQTIIYHEDIYKKPKQPKKMENAFLNFTAVITALLVRDFFESFYEKGSLNLKILKKILQELEKQNQKP